MTRQRTVMADSTETITQDGAAPASQKSKQFGVDYTLTDAHKCLSVKQKGPATHLTRYKQSTHCISLSAAWMCFAPALGLTTSRKDDIIVSEEEYLST